MARSKRCFQVVTLLLLASALSGCKTAGGKANVVLVNPPANAVIVERDFSDITRYPTATLVKPQEVPPLEANADITDWARWEAVIYRTDDPINEVVAFYEQEMPSAGWRGQWKSLGEGMSGSFSKDELVATISVSPGVEATSIVIVRAVRR